MVSTMRRLFAFSEEPVSVNSTIASTSSGAFTSVAPQENSTSAVTPFFFSQLRVISTNSVRSEEHTSELQSHRDLHSFPTRRSSDLDQLRRFHFGCAPGEFHFRGYAVLLQPAPRHLDQLG